MAPTIGRQWRGGTEDYAALCDYCDVRYLRSQLRKQNNGRLACFGPGTNGCGSGLDEVSLDKINADVMRNRRRPTKHLGGRFDRVRGSVEEILGASLIEYWDASKGIESTTDGFLTSWTGQKLGAVLLASPALGQARWFASDPRFAGRPAVHVTTGSFVTGIVPLLAPGQRPYIGYVGTLPDSTAPFRSGGFKFTAGAEDAAELFNGGSPAGNPEESPVIATYRSLSSGGSAFPMPRRAVGNTADARFYELDATEGAVDQVEFRVGKASIASMQDPENIGPWDRLLLGFGSATTLLVLANNPTAQQVYEFQTLGRAHAVKLP